MYMYTRGPCWNLAASSSGLFNWKIYVGMLRCLLFLLVHIIRLHYWLGSSRCQNILSPIIVIFNLTQFLHYLRRKWLVVSAIKTYILCKIHARLIPLGLAASCIGFFLYFHVVLSDT